MSKWKVDVYICRTNEHIRTVCENVPEKTAMQLADTLNFHYIELLKRGLLKEQVVAVYSEAK